MAVVFAASKIKKVERREVLLKLQSFFSLPPSRAFRFVIWAPPLAGSLFTLPQSIFVSCGGCGFEDTDWIVSGEGSGFALKKICTEVFGVASILNLSQRKLN
jgi:hypothetical protein